MSDTHATPLRLEEAGELEAEDTLSGAGRLVLLASVFVVASAGLVYELVAGTVSSYLLGDAVTQFSLVIGVFLSSMGLGSFLAKFVRRRLLHTFVAVEIWVGLIGGASSMVMLTVGAFLPTMFTVVFYALCIVIGALVGIEIPLLVRLVRAAGGVSAAVSDVLALDYLGALAGSVLFPLVVLPWLGVGRASVVFGVLNLVVAAAGVSLLPSARRRGLLAGLAAAIVLLSTMFGASTRIVTLLEDLLYDDAIIFATDTRYQRIVVTRWRDDVRLYLNGHLQFSSVDEARYHESLVIPAMEACARPRSVLILGGGDGMAVREVLKYPVESVTLVDIDPVMTRLGRERPELVALNGGALEQPSVRVVNTDAMRFLSDDRNLYDVVIVDLPDPSSAALGKLYSDAFYALVAHRLAEGGVMVTQAASPFYAREAFWCVATTIEAAVPEDHPAGSLLTVPYHVNVPSFGEWGFVLASRRAVVWDALRPSVPTRFLTNDVLAGMVAFGRDVERPDGVPVNRLGTPVLDTLYRRGWSRFNE